MRTSRLTRLVTLGATGLLAVGSVVPAAAQGTDDATYAEVEGASHYLSGGRRAEALGLIVDWLRARVP